MMLIGLLLDLILDFGHALGVGQRTSYFPIAHAVENISIVVTQRGLGGSPKTMG